MVITLQTLTGDMTTSGSWGASDCGMAEVRFYLDTKKANKTVEKMATAQTRSCEPEMDRTIALRGLKQNADYTVTSLNTGRSKKVKGAKLMSGGLKISFAKPGMSDIFLLKRN